MQVIGREGIPFDVAGMMSAIFGKTEDSEYSLFLGRNDNKSVTNGRDRLTDDREGKDYNSFGKTKKINF